MLEQSGPMAMTPLASRLGMDRTTLTRTLKPLEQRGLIKFEDDKKDQRIRNIVITPQGIEAALAALPRWEKAQVSAGVLLDRLGIEMHR
jgi:DNA-binding MarR family transcriptional regulator